MATRKETSLADLLKQNDFLILQPTNRILCKVTGHEMPARADAVDAHIKGKKFKKALEWYKYDYSEFLPHIVPHKFDAKKMFCQLTRQSLNRIPIEVRRHCEGKRFQRLKHEYEEKLKQKSNTAAAEADAEELDCWVPPSEVLNEASDGEDDDAAEDSSVASDEGGKEEEEVKGEESDDSDNKFYIRSHLAAVGTQRNKKRKAKEVESKTKIKNSGSSSKEISKKKKRQ